MLIKQTLYNAKNKWLIYPFEFAVCVMIFLYLYRGMNIARNFDTLSPERRNNLLSLPIEFIWAWIIIGLVGSILMFAGLTMSPFTIKGRMIEGMGLWISASMWLSVSVAYLLLDPGEISIYGQYLAITFACSNRLFALTYIHNALLRTKEEK